MSTAMGTALVGKLGQLLMQEYQLVSGVRGEVVLLRDDAAMINALLRMFSEADQDVVDHFAREWMKQVRDLAYDGEDCIDLFLCRISSAPPGTHCLGHAWHKYVTFWLRRRLANDIEALRARAIAISERRERYGVYGQALQPSEAFGSRVPTSSTPPVIGNANDGPSQFVGIDEHIASLSNILGPHPDLTLKVCSIVGIGGVGKTTLALAVCQALKKTIPYQRVVSISQQFDPSKILTAIQELAGQRYLMVIDDVWTVSAWDAIMRMLPQNDLGSRIIVTTRNKAVAAACSSGPNYIHQAVILNKEDSKSLFVRRVFGRKLVPLQSAEQTPIDPSSSSSQTSDLKDNDCHADLKAQMKIILQKCGGLPLGIVCIASVLARYSSPTSIEMWRRVCNSVGFQVETNPAQEEMMQIIALSYNHLPYNIKACVMILSIFPEDYHIPKWRIMRRWISEGLIPEKRGLTSLEVAEAYYDELLSRNIIQLVVLSDGTISVGHCCLHDMMREVIVSKSIEENFICLVGTTRGGTSSDTVRRLCIHSDVGYVADGRSMKHVRSLTTFGLERNDGVGKMLDGLSKFTLLRVLDLEDCQDVTNKHMKQVCRLFLLRLLNLNGTNISELPSEISNLQDLQSLMLWDTLLDKVPGCQVVKLEKLEYLSFQNKGNPGIRMTLPRGLNKMKALQHLVGIQIGNHDVALAEEIGDLVQLRELGVVVVNCGKHGHTNEEVQGALQSSVDKLKLCSLPEENVDIVYQ